MQEIRVIISNDQEKKWLKSFIDQKLREVLINVESLTTNQIDHNTVLNKETALRLLDAGYRITHRFFSDYEFIKDYDVLWLEDEKGYKLEKEEFFKERQGPSWETYWRLYEKQPEKEEENSKWL